MLGVSTSSGVSSGKAVESGSGAGSEFQELVAKLLGDCGIEANVDEVKAGQQPQEEKSGSENENEQKLSESIAQAECLLGSIGVILGTTDEVSAEVATISSPVQLDGASVPDTQGTVPVVSNDQAESLVKTEQVGPSVAENEVMDVVSEAQSNASTQGIASMTDVPDSYKQPESNISIESEEPKVLGEAVGLTKETGSSEKAGLSAEQVEPDAKTDFSDVKTAPASEKQTAKAASSAAGAVLSNEQEAAKAVETAAASQDQKLVSDAANSFSGSSRLFVQAAQTTSDGSVNQTANNQQVIISQSIESGPGDAIDLPPVEETKKVQDISDNNSGQNTGDISSQVTGTPGFRAADAVQNSEGNLPSEQALSTKVIHQIVKAAKVNITEGRSDIVLRLDPPHLGTVNMNVSVTGGTVTATIQTTTEAARQALQSDLATLKQSLSDAGINVDQINVSVGGNHDQSQGWNLNSGSHDWTAGGKANGGTFYGDPSQQDSEPVVDASGITIRTSSGRLDFLA